MDARIDVFALFGLSLGEVHVLRKAGGVVTDDVIRSLTISQRKLHTRDIALVRRDMALLRHDPFLVPDTRIRGFVLDLQEFHLQEVHGEDTAEADAVA
jgi:carbonic anhydrase